MQDIHERVEVSSAVRLNIEGWRKQRGRRRKEIELARGRVEVRPKFMEAALFSWLKLKQIHFRKKLHWILSQQLRRIDDTIRLSASTSSLCAVAGSILSISSEACSYNKCIYFRMDVPFWALSHSRDTCVLQKRPQVKTWRLHSSLFMLFKGKQLGKIIRIEGKTPKGCLDFSTYRFVCSFIVRGVHSEKKKGDDARNKLKSHLERTKMAF